MWIYVSHYGGKLLVLVSTVILARLLSQEDFGVAGYAFVFMSLMESARGLGIQQALIFFPAERERTNTAFWVGIGVGAAYYAIAFAIAPLAGWLFSDPRAVSLFRVLALALPISSLGLVHGALLRKSLAFNRQVMVQMGQGLVKGLASIALALLGYEYWSLILGHLGGVVAAAIVLWWMLPWRPTLEIQRSHVRPLLSYGLKIVFNGSLSAFLRNLDYLLVGHFMGAAALGVYTIAFRVPEVLIQQFSGVLGKVLFPVYVRMRDEGQELVGGFRSTMRYVNVMTVPMGVGLALVAEPFMLVLFTDKWAEGIPVLRALALYCMLRASVSNIGAVYKAQDRVGLLARIRLAQALVTVPALWWSATKGSVVYVAWMQAALALALTLTHLLVASRALRTPPRLLFESLRPAMVSASVMSLAVLATLSLTSDSPPVTRLLSGVGVGVASYVGTLWLLHRDLVLEGVHALRATVKRDGSQSV
jgi:PST family polysaccharide transporter